MNQNKKKIIKSYLKTYIEFRFPHLQIEFKKSFKCPFCEEHENDNGENTAVIYEDNRDLLFCFHPPHKTLGDIFDLARKIEGLEKLNDDDVGDYLTHLLDIKFGDDDTDKLFKRYEEAGFGLFPLSPNSKNPVSGVSWLKNISFKADQWREWYDNGLGLALALGEKTGTIAIDVDDPETEIKVKDKLSKTLYQTSKRGGHRLYNYDKDFDFLKHANLRNKGYDMEVRCNNAYIVVSPTIIDGVGRSWDDAKIEDMSPETKKFLLDLIDKKVETKDDKIQKAITNNDLSAINLGGLEGCCNDTFIKYGGILRKTMNIANVTTVLYNLNNMLTNPMDKKTMRAIIAQIDKYNKYDKEELANIILDRLEIVEESTAFKLACTLKLEQKDVEEVLKHLLDEEKLTKEGDKFCRTKRANWRTDFMSVEKQCPFPVPYLDEFSYFKDGSMIMIGAVTGTGKCFGKGTKILMYDGSYKNVEDIIVNDKVMGVDSNPRNVTNLSRGNDTMYKIFPNKGNECIVNSRHILSLKNTRNKKITNISLDEYLKKPAGFKHLNKLYRVPVEFNEQETELEPYYLGVWLGDGSSSSQRITNPDGEIHDYLQCYAKSVGLDFKFYPNGEKCPYMSIIGNKTDSYKCFNIQRALTRLKVLNNKHIPSVYKINSRENRLQLLAGLLDTDGHLSCGGFEITTKYNRLAEDIIYLGRSLGFNVNKSIKNVKLDGWNEPRQYHRLYISGDCSIIPTKIKRKQANKRKMNKDVLVTGFKIEKLDEGKYYGFELDGDHLHLIEDFTVHHNTTMVGNMLKFYKEKEVVPYLLSSEKTSGISDVASSLGLVEGDFKIFNSKKLQNVELEDNAVTIIDWLRPVDSQYFKMDQIFENLDSQVNKHGGLLIVFVQLRSTDRAWFARDLIEFNSYLACKYLHTEMKDANGKVTGYDRQNTYLDITKMRKPKNKISPTKFIPLTYNADTERITKR